MPTAVLNHHTMPNENHGSGEPVFLSGGWGTFRQGGSVILP